MFYFVVRHLRWLARVPGLPHVFEAILLAETFLFRRSRLAAMETLEAEALRRPGLELHVHRLGGVEFVCAGRELGHLHGHGLLDARVGRARAKALLRSGRVRPHHVFPHSVWISFQLESTADVSYALALMSGDEENH
jgi:hypothetical protein